MPVNRNDRLRFRYGICLNDNCEKCKSKEVQQITSRRDFVCEECGKTLRECPPPKSFRDKFGKMIIAAGAVLLLGGVVFAIRWNNSRQVPEIDPESPLPTPVPIQEPITDPITGTGEGPVIEPIAEPDPAPVIEETTETKAGVSLPPPARSSISVPFGIYTGPANGLDGEIKVTKAYSLDLRNAAHETLELLPGDIITSTKFKNGELVSGYWSRGSLHQSFHR